MSKMSSVVKKAADADKYSVCAGVLGALRKFDSFIGYSLEPLYSMERPCTGQRSTLSRNIWVHRLVDIGL